MLYLYAGAGVLLLIFVFFITNRYLKREYRYKLKMNHFLGLNQYSEAIDLAKKLIALRAKKAEYFLLLADIYLKAKKIPSAIETYETMLKNKIFSVKIREHIIREKIALVNLNSGKIKEAFSELFSITQIKPNSYGANGLLGRIYGSQKKYDKAKEYLKKAIHLNPKDAEFHYQLGVAYLDTGDLGQAVQELDKAYHLDSEHVKAQYFLALACRQKGLNEKAKMLFEKLKLNDLSSLPENITNIGIMTQNVPQFDIKGMTEKMEDESGSAKSDTGANIHTIEEFINCNIEEFHGIAVSIVNKMGYTVQKEVKDRLIDNSIEIDFIAVSKRDELKKCFIQFTKSKQEIGTIPFADFLSKMNEAHIKNGIFIITSVFSDQIHERVEKENVNIVLIDEMKLRKYL
ncbi:MAG: tetratricopeptide repeat protein [Spirochaetes bacterium]|nr:tetratricopeptide repeat protein [Spirochaetota bacterium]